MYHNISFHKFVKRFEVILSRRFISSLHENKSIKHSIKEIIFNFRYVTDLSLKDTYNVLYKKFKEKACFYQKTIKNVRNLEKIVRNFLSNFIIKDFKEYGLLIDQEMGDYYYQLSTTSNDEILKCIDNFSFTRSILRQIGINGNRIEKFIKFCKIQGITQIQLNLTAACMSLKVINIINSVRRKYGKKEI